MDGLDLVLVLRYRKAVTYGFHVLLGALEEHRTATRFEVRFGDTAESTARHIRAARAEGAKVLVLWSFYSPDAAALAVELAQIRGLADGAEVLHVAGGVHATAEPVQTLDAGWDVAAIGEGETTLLKLVDAAGDPSGVAGLVYRDAAGAIVKTGRPERRPLDDFRGFSLRWNRFNALESLEAAFSLAHRDPNYCVSAAMTSAPRDHRGPGTRICDGWFYATDRVAWSLSYSLGESMPRELWRRCRLWKFRGSRRSRWPARCGFSTSCG